MPDYDLIAILGPTASGKLHLPPHWQQNSIQKSSAPTPGKYTGVWISVPVKTWPITL